jgi:hypothetical protein
MSALYGWSAAESATRSLAPRLAALVAASAIDRVSLLKIIYRQFIDDNQKP